MSDQDLFAQKPKEGDDPLKQTASDPFADQLKDIVAEDGRQKYSSTEDALKALKESQGFIETLKREKAQTEADKLAVAEELKKMKTLEEFAASLKPEAPKAEPAATPASEPKGVDADTVKQLLETTLREREATAVRSNNLKSVVDNLTVAYGDKASDHIQKVADEMGTTPEKLKDLAAENPKLALTILGTNGSPKVVPSTSTLSPRRVIDDANPLPAWEKGAARGGMTDKQLVARWKEVGSYTQKRLASQE